MRKARTEGRLHAPVDAKGRQSVRAGRRAERVHAREGGAELLNMDTYVIAPHAELLQVVQRLAQPGIRCNFAGCPLL